jgi:hypothetical protein
LDFLGKIVANGGYPQAEEKYKNTIVEECEGTLGVPMKYH